VGNANQDQHNQETRLLVEQGTVVHRARSSMREIMHLKIHVIGPDPVEPVVRTETTAHFPHSTATSTPDPPVTTTRSFPEWQLERRRWESALISVVALQGQDDESAETVAGDTFEMCRRTAAQLGTPLRNHPVLCRGQSAQARTVEPAVNDLPVRRGGLSLESRTGMARTQQQRTENDQDE
jgi:hypothetical protein